MKRTKKPLDIDYRPATEDDLRYVHGLEMLIEGDNAASFDTLAARFKMHPHGFIVAHHNSTMVGYLQSCIWHPPAFDTFDDIKNFPQHHTESGTEAYVIFLGVREEYRRRGIATNMLEKISVLAAMDKLDSISLVAKEPLIQLYQKNGLEIVCDMPNFLADSNENHFLMRRDLSDKPVFNPTY